MPCIYKITNLLNGKVYIGQTIKSAEERFKEHKHFARMPKYRRGHLQHSIAKYGAENFTVEVIEECPRSMLAEREIYWIDKFDAYNKGYNMTLGGDGASVPKDTDIILDHWNRGLSTTDIAKAVGRDREHVSNELKVSGITDEEITRRGYKVAGKKNREPVYQYGLDGNFIREFASSFEVEEELGISRSSIFGVIGGQHPTAGGYQWRKYKTSENIGKQTYAWKTNKIAVRYELTGEVFSSIKEAERETGISHKTIKKYLDKNPSDERYCFTRI